MYLFPLLQARMLDTNETMTYLTLNCGGNFSVDDGAVLRPGGVDPPSERQVHPEVGDDLLAQPVRPVLRRGDRLQVQGIRLQERNRQQTETIATHLPS